MVEIAVSDEGFGLSRDDLQNLFRPFFRSPAHHQEIPGTGLGLYITAQIVERHGGRIHAESELGRGSTFTVQLPLTPPSQAAADVPGTA
jgi:signal transduction histidine kinase